MIFIDASETRATSRTPEIEDAKISPCLEAFSGADVMVSPLCIPATTESLIRKHASSGAVFIQVKHLSDFVNSITDERINVALARMIAIGTTHQYQRVICSVGFFLPDTDDGITMIGELKGHRGGKAFIHFRRMEPEISYQSVATIRRRIGFRGGFYLPLICKDELIPELHAIERDLLYLSKKPIKELFTPEVPYPPDPADPTDPLQEVREVKDGRLVIAAIKGIGPVKANDLWKAIEAWNRIHLSSRPDPAPTLSQALFWASVDKPDDFDIPKIRGWGIGTRRNVRKQMGLDEGVNFRGMPDSWGKE